MSIFDRRSRYPRYSHVLTATDERGRTVNWLTPAQIPEQRLLGEHRRKAGHRLDRLAAHYLDDATGYWRIATLNDAMTPDAIADAPLVKIPTKDG
jgi:hypothetical protein